VPPPAIQTGAVISGRIFSMKALMVNPRLPLSFWNFKSILKIINKKIVYIPLGLITAAALLPQNWELKLVDLNAEKLMDDMINWADLIFISAMIVQKESVRRIIDRSHYLGKQVVVGGPLFNHGVDKEFVDIEYQIHNEAEITLPRFLEDFKAGKPKRIYRTAKRFDIRETPIPRWDLLNMKYYASITLQFSRGCPFGCEFCDIPLLYGRIPRTKTIPQMIKEFSCLYENGWKGRVFIADDNFIGNIHETKNLLRKIRAWQKYRSYPFALSTEASINLARDDELLHQMITAGFNSVFIGLETPDENTLKKCGKHQNSKINLLTEVRKIQSKGIKVNGGFIVGFDSDPEDIFDRQIRFIQESGIATAMIGILYALPGTRLYKRLKKEGRLIETTSTGSNTDALITFVPKMGIKTLLEGYMSVVNYIYAPRNYYDRILNFLKYYQPGKGRSVKLTDFFAFLRSIVILGVLNNGKARRYYWKTILQAVVYGQKYFNDIIEYAIFSYHFQKQTDRINDKINHKQ
jgi:radical SAM superfamily enzyme YgiQ (UPF0313 family)